MRWLGRWITVLVVASAAALFAGAGSALATAGDPDPSFAGDGGVTTPFGDGQDVGRAVAVDALRRIVVVGEDGSAGGENFALARYLPGGQLDPSFGGDGTVTTSFGNPPGAYGAAGIAIQPNGRLVVV